MIECCRNTSFSELEFYLTDGFITIICRRQKQAIEAVTPKSAPSSDPGKGVADATLFELMAISGRSDRTKSRQQVINPLRADGLIEMTISDKPRSSLQKYRLTAKGKALIDAMIPEGEKS